VLKKQRHQNILATLKLEGKVVARELTQLLQTSEDTVRRDLNEMATLGLLHRVHGGALPQTSTAISYGFRERESNAAKASIAAACVKMLRPGQVIMMDGGTTTHRVAQDLTPDFRGTILTNSVAILETLSSHPTVDVIGVGGRLFKEARCMVGAQAVGELSAVRADICIIGLNGIHPDVGLCALDYESVPVKAAMIRGARQVVAVTASQKIGTVAPFVFGEISSLTHLVTDSDAPEQALRPYRDAGIIVLTG